MTNHIIHRVEELDEILLIENPNRHVIFPIKYFDIWELCEAHRKAFWVEDEVNLEQDLVEWKKLNPNEQHFIKNVLAFFAASDGIVIENLGTSFLSKVQLPEARLFYTIQLFMESIHSIMYSKLIDTYITDPDEKEKLFKAIETMPAIQKKAEWALKWIDDTQDFTTRMVAFAIVEGIFFSGSFCAIYWLKEQGKLPGLCLSNDFIARDESLHTMHACLLYTKYITHKLSQERMEQIVREAVIVEKEFIIDSLPCRLLGMNSKMMEEYIEYVANRLIKQLGHTEIYPNAKMPFPFMERICLDSQTNFFEKRSSDYQTSFNVEVKREALNFDVDF